MPVGRLQITNRGCGPSVAYRNIVAVKLTLYLFLNSIISLELMMEFRNKYRVSLTATILRYATLGPQPLFVICSRPTGIKWKHPGRNFPFHKLMISEYGSIAEGTQAGNF